MPSSWKPPAKSACSTKSRTRSPDPRLSLLAAANCGGRRWTRALRAAGDPASLLALSDRSLQGTGLKTPDIARLRRVVAPPASWQHWLEQPGHSLVFLGEQPYPTLLAQLDDAPLALWNAGSDLSLLGNPQLAIVGSRHPTENGRRTAESFAAGLAASGITITSGLASGIDAASHRGALTGVGATIAVSGCGIDSIYPAGNRKLAAAISERGLIVSEYAPGTPVRAGQFPRRNRIIAALSLGTLVVEATRRSGSLITARLAGEFGREVFAVPGSIHSPLSKGCHKLIVQGARLVDSIEDILLELAPQLHGLQQIETPADSCRQSDDFPDVLRKCLDYSPITLDSLQSATGLTAAELSSMLLHLEIQGKIEALPGGRYCRLKKRA